MSNVASAGAPRSRSATTHVGFLTESFLDDQDNLFEGGAERHLLRLAELARRLGAQVTVYQRSTVTGRTEYAGIPVVRRPVCLARLGAVLGRLALEDACTHLHFQYLEQVPPGLPGDRVTATCHALHWDLPYVAAYHSWYPGDRLARLVLPLWRWHERTTCLAALTRCRAVLSTDTSLLRLVQSLRPELRGKVEVVPNFSDLNPLDRHDSDDNGSDAALSSLVTARQEGATIVLVPRNLSFVRGGAWLADIVRLTAERYHSNCHFFVTGVPVPLYGRADRYRRLLGQAVGRLDPATRERLHLLGGLPRDAMPNALDLSDIVLIPTFANEGTSLAALEAMCFGRAVVSTNVGGLNDVVRDGLTGLIVQTDVDAIAAAVALLAGDSALRSRLGEEAQREAAARFTLAAWGARAERFATRAGWTPDAGFE